MVEEGISFEFVSHSMFLFLSFFFGRIGFFQLSWKLPPTCLGKRFRLLEIGTGHTQRHADTQGQGSETEGEVMRDAETQV